MRVVTLTIVFILSLMTCHVVYSQCNMLTREVKDEFSCDTSHNFSFILEMKTVQSETWFVASGTFKWYQADANGNKEAYPFSTLYTGGFSTGTISSNKIYWLEWELEGGNCTGSTVFTPGFGQYPPAPVAHGLEKCGPGGGTISVDGLAGGTYTWRYNGTIFTSGATVAGATVVVSANEVQFTSLSESINGITVDVYAQTNCGPIDYESIAVPIIIKPIPSITMIDETICKSAGPVALAVSPSGGSWSGTGMSSNLFYPASVSVGNFTETYTYTSPTNGCTGVLSKTITVTDPLPMPNQSFNAEYNEPFTFTLNHPSNKPIKWYDSPTGGTLLHTGAGLYTTDTIKTTNLLYVATVDPSLSSCESTQRATIAINSLPVNNYNYVREEVMLMEGITTGSNFPDLTTSQKLMSIKYFDDLGRQMQTVQWKSNPYSKDIIFPMVYDSAGREAVKYLPYSVNATDGRYRKQVIAEQAEFFNGSHMHIPSDSAPYAVSRFEASPLNRVIEQGAPGGAWQPGTGHSIVKEYQTNSATQVILFMYDSNTGGVYVSPGSEFYPANQLVLNKTRDEHNNEVHEFVNKEGMIICKKVMLTETLGATTYYVYDDLGNLVIVIQPEGVKVIESQINTN